jgi:alpha-glucosidase
MLVFHGANKPTGRARTWPNEMVREAVRGMESSGLMERARHQTILPFTRLLAGPADYTTMLFTERRRDTTVANQIASMAVFAAPVLTIAANPQSILTSPAVDVIKSIPATWDDTLVLPGSEIGELAIYARRSGTTWFVAVMNGPSAKSIRIPLSFLGTGRYATTAVRDGADDASVSVATESHGSADAIALDLRAGGGFVAKLIPAR